ncbi:DUF5668 domain-containing protein [bacterium]|nr:DUF5668 domain-containing protein [bacterium]
MFFGLAIILIGTVFLLNSLGIISGEIWNIIWPSLLILIGLSIFLKDIRRENRWCNFERKAERFFKDE